MASKTRRRSQSASAVSRKESTISAQFSNSRDNPLFWDAADGDATEEISEILRPISSFVKKNLINGGSNSSGGDELRGRSATRSLSGKKNGIGRSLSTARARPHGYSSDESEKGQNMATAKRPSSTNGTKSLRNGLARTTSVGNKLVDTRNFSKNGRASIRRNEDSEFSQDDSNSFKAFHGEDGISTSSLSEAEAKTIQDFFDNIILGNEDLSGDDMPLSEIYEAPQSEVKYAIPDIQDDHITAFRRNYANTVQNFAGMPSDIVDPRTAEFISGIERECVIKLEETEERARELRADLAFEEHRARELNRMLEEIPPEAQSVRKPRRGRRASNERRNMSELLTEEAMAYFDECVSLSTFDSSDFSASEDIIIPHNSLGANAPIDALSQVKGSTSTSYRSYDQVNNFRQKQIHGYEDSVISMNSSSESTMDAQQPRRFSFEARNSSADIQSYVKHFEKDSISPEYKRSSFYDAEEYISSERIMLIDRVLYRRSIETGGLLLCAGRPFSSFV